MPIRTAAMLAASLAAISCALPAAAQGPPAAQTAPSGRTVFPPSFFAGFNPANAQEMLQRVPGFTLSGGNSDVRGFAGAGGNVLIDGERPASKSVGLQDLLRRIPVSAVERIELIRAGDPAIDLQGQPLVANVVRRAGAGGSVTVTAGANRYSDGWVAPRLSVEASKQAGPLLLEGAVRAESGLDTDSGTGSRRAVTPSGLVLRDQPLFYRERGTDYRANGSATLRRAADVLRLNASAKRSGEKAIELIGARRTVEDETQHDLELGGDYERTLSATLNGKLVALQTLGWVKSSEDLRDLGGVETSASDQKSGESILRGSLSWRPTSALSFESGGEGAFNWLESDTAVTKDGRPVPLPNDNIRVEERRAEAFATGTWTLSSKLSLEGALRLETSKISQSGDSALDRDFFFAKPRVTLSYAPGSLTNVRLRLEREVGQLNFKDFAASADLNLGSVNAGNAGLEPERSWVAEAAFERRFWGAGAVVLTLTHSWVQDVVDLLPINGAFDGPGNIGDGTRDVAKLTLAVPLDRLGVPGGRISGEGLLRRSSVTDPVTGEKRRIAGQSPTGGSATFTQDLPRLKSTWSIESDFGGTETQNRIDEIRRDTWNPFYTAAWEYKPTAALSIRFAVANFTGRPTERRRILFDGPRSRGVVEAVEQREAKLDPYYSLRIRRVF